jgi:hypothetical protein
MVVYGGASGRFLQGDLDKVLDFIIGIKDSRRLMDVEMHGLCRFHDRDFQKWRV